MEDVKFWEKILGFKPEAVFEPRVAEYKCYKCESINMKQINSPAWTSKRQCKDCNYFTYVVHADFMGGAFCEDVAIDKRDSKMEE